MEILLNGKAAQITAEHLSDLTKDEKTIVIYNGYQTDRDLPLKEGDSVVLIPKGEMPKKDQLEAMLTARLTPGVHEKFQKGKVAVAGLGGLGSNIAVMLAQSGVGELLLVDFDTVEPSNLNRQHYSMRHLGLPKTEALKEQIQEVNPFVKVETATEKITEDNVKTLFNGYAIVCEALDGAESKAMLINKLLLETDATVVAASGMAGYESSNTIRTVRPMKRLYVSGDGESEAKPGQGLFAPRVQICAGHQANMVLRLLLKEEEV